MTKHFLDKEVKRVAEAPVVNFYGGVYLVRKGRTHYLAKSHWNTGLVAKKVSNEFAEAFIKEFGNG